MRTYDRKRANDFRGVLLPLTCTFLLAACGSDEAHPPLGVSQQAIAGGQVDSEETWLGVVYLRTKIDKRRQLCSGTVIAPNLVVTALHCIAPLVDSDFRCDYAGNVIQGRPGAGELGLPVAPSLIEVRVGFDAPVSEIAAHGKQLFTTNSPNICTNDLAFVVLDTDLDLPTSPVRLSQDTILGEALTIVGYGATEKDQDDSVRRFRDEVRVTDLGTDNGSNPLSGAPPRTLVVGPSACQGDSGVPAFAANKSGHGDPSQMVIAGVNSIAVGTCGAKDARSLFTRLDPFKSLLEQAFTASGHTMWEEGQTVAGEQLPDPTPTPAPTKPDPQDNSKPRRLTTGCTLALPGPSCARPWAFWASVLGGCLFLSRRAWSSRR
jgi:hypothetical protein